jgi:predicted  nucleic acid-binding Zn-ribbon protein
MTDHSQKADEVERELDDLQHESERLKGDISETREDWERKKRDDAVPGAAGEPAKAEGDLPPEAEDA